MEYKVGDWVFCEYELSYIKELKEGRITEVSDGSCSHGSYDLSDRIFPLERFIKVISESYKHYYDELHKYDFNGLNWPDIHRWFVNHWVETCKNKNGDKDYFRKRWDEVRDFVNGFRDNYKDMKVKTVGGVSILRN